MEVNGDIHKPTVINSETICQEPPGILIVETLMDANPLVVPPTVTNGNNLSPENFNANRARRRSSGSILTTLHSMNPLTPWEARRR